MPRVTSNSQAYSGARARGLRRRESCAGCRSQRSSYRVESTGLGKLAARGQLYVELGDWDKAAEDFSAAIKLQPDHSEAWTARAFAYFHRQQWDQAVADFSKAIELAPQVHTNWLHRGHSYLQLAQWDKAAADFTKVIEGWPDDPGGWYFRGRAYAQLNQPEKAITDLRQAIAKGFKDVEQMKTDPKARPAPLQRRV